MACHILHKESSCIHHIEDALISVSRAQSVRPIYVWRLCMAYRSQDRLPLHLCLHFLRRRFVHGPTNMLESMKLKRV